MQSTSLLLLATCLVPCLAFYKASSFSLDHLHQKCVRPNLCGNKDGRFASCTSCDEYVSCRGGEYTVTPCYYGTTFDTFLLICIPNGICDLSSLVAVQPRNQGPGTTSGPDIEPRVSDDPSGSTTPAAGQSTSSVSSATTTAAATTQTTTEAATTQAATTQVATTQVATTQAATASTTANPTTTEVTPEIENRVTGQVETTPIPDDAPEVQGREQRIITQSNGRFSRNLIFETGCFKSCAGLPSGSYPNCAGCDKVLICMGNQTKRKTCFLGETFDDEAGICQRYSSTCRVEVKRVRSYFNHIGYSQFL